MKANEVRIGNYINYETEREIVTMQITYEYIRLIHNGDKKFKPIELTEEWLLKFGFKQISERVYIKNYHYGYEFGITNIFIIKNDNCFMRYKHIQYVHELQNLYFALTNEELTL